MNEDLFFHKWEFIKNSSFFLYIIIGGRGIGKTYDILKGLITDDEYFIYVRRSESELKNCCKEVNNPFVTINEDFNRNIEVSRNEDSFIIHEGEVIKGIGGSLSTFGKFRGSDFSKVNYIVFDEFIATSPFDRLIKSEAELFFNMIETIERNREILGKRSIKIIMLANSNRLNSGIITELKLGEVIRQMKLREDFREYEDEERGIYINLPEDLGITKLKKNTKLYKLTADTEFYKMAIGNDFVDDDFNVIKSFKSNELIPLCRFSYVSFYRVKGQNILYCTKRSNNSPLYTKSTLKDFKRKYGMFFKKLFEKNRVFYSDYDVKMFVNSIF